ncbi:MAG: SPASM domain-containing protein [Clostridiales bacterium]|nr:SPASM domain-containing protein [Clostridiales bacterium]
MLEHPLGELTLKGFCYDMSETRISDFLEKNPECVACEHLPQCTGGCMVESMTEEGDFLVPDKRTCYFHKHIGADAVRKVADEAIKKYCVS